MELVDYDRQAGEYGAGNIPVRTPHVDCYALDHASISEAMQPASQGEFVTICKHLDRFSVAYVGNDAAHLPVNLSFINAKPGRKRRMVIGINLRDVLSSDIPNGLVVAPNVVSNAQERVFKALVFDECNASLSHTHIVLNASQWLNKRSSALSALVPLHIGYDADMVPSDRAVAVGNWFCAVPVQIADHTAFGTGSWLNSVFGFDFVFVARLMFGCDLPARKVKDVSHQSVCLHKANPMGIRSLSGFVPEQRFFISEFEYFTNFYLHLGPFKNQNTFIRQNSKAFRKSASNIIAPIFTKNPVFFPHPAILASMPKMWRVEYNQLKTTVIKRHITEIKFHVWANAESPSIAKRMLFGSYVSKQNSLIIGIKPKHATATTRIKDYLIGFHYESNSTRYSVLQLYCIMQNYTRYSEDPKY